MLRHRSFLEIAQRLGRHAPRVRENSRCKSWAPVRASASSETETKHDRTNAVTRILPRSRLEGGIVNAKLQRLPVVDVAPLYSEDLADRVRAATHLAEALHRTGCFYAVGHQVPEAAERALVSRAEALFALPIERKMRWYIGDSKNHRGYVPTGEEVFYSGTEDQKEAFDLGYELPEHDPDVVHGTPMLGPNRWPDVDGFRADVSAYYAHAFELGQRLFRGVALALGLAEQQFVRFVNKPPSQLRLIHYPYTGSELPGIAQHTDYECFTILYATEPGLEVMDRAGNWLPAPPLEGAFVVTLGDLLEVWTNGELLATPHRVRPVRSERYSFPLFCSCDYFTKVSPLPDFVSSHKPARYPSLVAGEHLFAQTAQSFRYLQRRLKTGSLRLPDNSRPLASFGPRSTSGIYERAYAPTGTSPDP